MKTKILNKKTAEENENSKIPAAAETGQKNPEVIQNIELSMIACNPFNPRRYRVEEDLDELKTSILNYGIIQPVTLRMKDDRYEIVCGERRYRASLMAGLLTVPAIVKNYSDGEAMEITILENLQRRDINPVEEAVSFGKLMEMRSYSIDDLVKQFGKTDKYIRSRLQLRNLIDSISQLLAEEEITLATALEIARFSPEIQEEVFNEHLGDDSYSWKKLQARDFRRLMENAYSTDLSKYEFDKSDCIKCRSNSSIYDLFLDGGCGSCQNLECLRYKQAEYVASEASRLMKEKQNANIGICITPNSFASSEIVSMMDAGHEIYEMVPVPMPSAPVMPAAENFESEDEYRQAEDSYSRSIERYNIHLAQIETMVDKGEAQLMVDVSRRKPELCYRVIAETAPKPENQDTAEQLRKQDRRYREIAFETGVEDIKRLVKEKMIPESKFQPLEEELLYFIMLSCFRHENYQKLGLEAQSRFTDEEKAGIIASLNEEQKNIIRRDFIVKNLTQTSGDCRQSHLLIDFASLHFPDEVRQIKNKCNDVYKKRHNRIEERIRELQPYSSVKNEEETVEAEVVPEEQDAETIQETETVVIEEETFDEPDTDAITLYPGLPEQAEIGGTPIWDEELMDIACAETAA
jgi:ParB family chromosome partitioning protein